ncbi:MAG: hypothetical protein K2H09_07605 [Treponemataceae bacterium]|nr:hypothetical protein [Treponemataceae bacterium]
MNKNGVVLAAACLCVLVSCTDEDKTVRVPDVQLQKNNTVTIALARNENAKYINIFRKKDAEDDGAAINIGEIIPTDKDNLTAYQFVDQYFLKDEKYEYAARYCFSDGYILTGWGTWNSDEPLSGTKSYSWNDFSPDAYLEYNEETKCLEVCGDDIPAVLDSDSKAADDFSIVLVLSYAPDSNTKKTRTFAVNESGEISAGLAVGKVINLRSVLPQDFFDKPVSVVGMIGQKVDKSENYTMLFWSELQELPVKDVDGNVLADITIPFNSSADDMYDYSGINNSAAVKGGAHSDGAVRPASFEYIPQL